MDKSNFGIQKKSLSFLDPDFFCKWYKKTLLSHYSVNLTGLTLTPDKTARQDTYSQVSNSTHASNKRPSYLIQEELLLHKNAKNLTFLLKKKINDGCLLFDTREYIIGVELLITSTSQMSRYSIRQLNGLMYEQLHEEP